MNSLLTMPNLGFRGRSWSKYGGSRSFPEDRVTWYCQKCGRAQTKELRTYLERMFDDESHEYKQICSTCAPRIQKTFIVIEKTEVDIE